MSVRVYGSLTLADDTKIDLDPDQVAEFYWLNAFLCWLNGVPRWGDVIDTPAIELNFMDARSLKGAEFLAKIAAEV